MGGASEKPATVPGALHLEPASLTDARVQPRHALPARTRRGYDVRHMQSGPAQAILLRLPRTALMLSPRAGTSLLAFIATALLTGSLPASRAARQHTAPAIVETTYRANDIGIARVEQVDYPRGRPQWGRIRGVVRAVPRRDICPPPRAIRANHGRLPSPAGTAEETHR